MARHRFFLLERIADTGGPSILPLAAEDLHHARDVLRVRKGEEIEVVQPDATVWRVEAVGFEDEGLCVRPLALLEQGRAPRVALVQGVAKGDKMDTIVRQAVEVGVVEVLPVLTSRSIVRIAPEKRAAKAERWRRVAKAAAEQSHRCVVPTVHEPLGLEEAASRLAAYDAVFVLWEECRGPGLTAAIVSADLADDATVALVVGPEGGLAEEEVSWLTEHGARTVTIGPNILRTETASIVGLALAVHARGGLGSNHD